MDALLCELCLLLVCQLLIPTSQALNETNTTTLEEEEILRRGYIPHPDVGFAYKVYTENVSWTEASERCKSEDAKLAVIDTKKKLEYARIPPLDCDQLRHVGIHWVDEVWVTVSNESISYTSIPWSSDEPGPRYNGFECVMVGWKRLNFAGLMNGRCDKFVGEYICEIPIPNNFTIIETTTESSKEIITQKQKLLEDLNKRLKSVEDRVEQIQKRVSSESIGPSHKGSQVCEISPSNNVNENEDTSELERIYKLLESIEKQFIDDEKSRSSNSSHSLNNDTCTVNPECSCSGAKITPNSFTFNSTTETTETIFTDNISTRKEAEDVTPTTSSNPHGV